MKHNVMKYCKRECTPHIMLVYCAHFVGTYIPLNTAFMNTSILNNRTAKWKFIHNTDSWVLNTKRNTLFLKNKHNRKWFSCCILPPACILARVTHSWATLCISSKDWNPCECYTAMSLDSLNDFLSRITPLYKTIFFFKFLYLIQEYQGHYSFKVLSQHLLTLASYCKPAWTTIRLLSLLT
jgi:hypothetical protein